MVERVEIASTPSEVREQMQDQGYANLDFALDSRQRNSLFRSFKNFVQLTQEPGGEKLVDALTYRRNDLGNSAYFLTLRQPGIHNPHEDQREAGQDHKYIMHHGVQTTKRAEAALGEALPREMENFLAKCDEFYFNARIAAELGAKALGIEKILLPENEEDDVHLLRVIDYIASDSEELGEAHFDRSAVTMACGESSPGLRGLPADNGFLKPVDEEVKSKLTRGLKPVKHYEGVAKFFAAAGLRRLPEEIRSKNSLDDTPLLAHDIINERPGENRQAVVMFFNPHINFSDYTVPGKDETRVMA